MSGLISAHRRAVAAPSVTIVGAFSVNNPGSPWTLSWPSGTAADDLFVMAFVDWSGAEPTEPSGWTREVHTWDTLPYDIVVMSKKLTSGEVSSPPSISGIDSQSVIDGVVIRGADTFTVRENQLGTGSTLTFDGFSPAGATKGALAFVYDRDPGSTPAEPGDWTEQTAPHSSTLFAGTLISKLDYAGGSVAFTSFTASFAQQGVLGELL